MERDGIRSHSSTTSYSFQSTRSAWSATLPGARRRSGRSIFQSTRSAWSATRTMLARQEAIEFQSTRSAWSATRIPEPENPFEPISIHALRMERDVITSRTSDGIARFQSTRSAWSATTIPIPAPFCPDHFNPRAPHGARPPQELAAMMEG